MGHEESTTSRTPKQELGDAVETKNGINFPGRCRLHPDNDLYRDQNSNKIRLDINEWQCGYCKKSFYEEKYLDKHFDNRHYNLLNVSHSRCLADVCGALHCDHVMDISLKTKCNPAALQEIIFCSLADSCFPVNEGRSASRLHEFFLRQFCDAHTCKGNQKPFSRGRKYGEEDEYLLPHRLHFNHTAAAAILYIHVLVSEGTPKTDTGLTKWKEKKPLSCAILLLYLPKLFVGQFPPLCGP
ncbi:hypothetical protein FEM48_ZijujUnG0044000 [Ziziphus jujuba var. spinosa]|uniref:C2H2-type domain-containing protein n=1 Tax=Ziziphus jujuba var. spinosa TaxID=714518 RepID=A0A978U9A2_ZIZJJ|nr:hypothetical protein FEM48_ZijujUnG0044000 [Ziziphus jujuba var. spinosa]